jgi:hypothetical protein
MKETPLMPASSTKICGNLRNLRTTISERFVRRLRRLTPIENVSAVNEALYKTTVFAAKDRKEHKEMAFSALFAFFCGHHASNSKNDFDLNDFVVPGTFHRKGALHS